MPMPSLTIRRTRGHIFKKLYGSLGELNQGELPTAKEIIGRVNFLVHSFSSESLNGICSKAASELIEIWKRAIINIPTVNQSTVHVKILPLFIKAKLLPELKENPPIKS